MFHIIRPAGSPCPLLILRMRSRRSTIKQNVLSGGLDQRGCTTPGPVSIWMGDGRPSIRAQPPPPSPPITTVGFSVVGSLPSGIGTLQASTHTFRRFLKTGCFRRPLATPNGSLKCLRFDHFLTLCTHKIYLLKLLTKACNWQVTREAQHNCDIKRLQDLHKSCRPH